MDLGIGVVCCCLLPIDYVGETMRIKQHNATQKMQAGLLQR